MSPELLPQLYFSLDDTGDLLALPEAVPICKLVLLRCTSQIPSPGPAHHRHPASAHYHYYTCSQGPLPSPPALTSLLVALGTAKCHPQEDRWEDSESVFKAYTALHLRASKSAHSKQPDGHTEAPGARRPLPAPPGAVLPRSWSPRETCLPHSRHKVERAALVFQSKAFICGFYL